MTQLRYELGEVAVARLLRTASRQVVYAGQTVVHSGQSRRAGILLHGLLRSFVRFPGGDSATVDYMRGPEFYGLTSLFHSSPTSIDALKTSTVLVLDAETVSGLAADGPGFALYLARQLAYEVAQVPAIVEEFAVMTVTQRVAAHLFAISERETPSGPRVRTSLSSCWRSSSARPERWWRDACAR
jgi:CRP-like cAMP-binding protein